VKIFIASDLHFEFQRDAGATLIQEFPPADVFVCAGDLCSASGLADALDLCCGAYRHVVFVAGNHEYYGSSFPVVRATLARAVRRHGGRLQVLDHSTCTIGGQRFVGTTMWIRSTPEVHARQHAINDFECIEDADPLVYEENARALVFLEREVTSGDIVVTHHLPCEASVHKKYKRSPITCFFLCDMEALIVERQPKMWIHGHTHEEVDLHIDATRVICNPFGYAGRETNPQFNSSLIVDV
jgi:predicted phosphodiesterase